ncbi:MAG: hypothetical protein FD126_3568 [Elusimicrobia bacterium]|nr:MAG: hypothetical protein FD126_3568 [Elusimicrobiota bacterium]
MAQRIVDQLNAAKPEYNRKVQTASTMVEKLRLQIRDQKAKSAELQKSIDAILTDSDPANDDMALGLINTRKAVDASTASTVEQLELGEKTLTAIKQERARFFAEREETLAKIQAGLTRAEQASIQKEMAELRGGFQVGDLKDNIDRFEDAVREKEAEAKTPTPTRSCARPRTSTATARPRKSSNGARRNWPTRTRAPEAPLKERAPRLRAGGPVL